MPSTSKPDPEAIRSVAAELNQLSDVLVITGAGMSAESGLPTYRGVGGLYQDKKTDDGISIETALSGSIFRNDPNITWKYLHQIEQACRGAHYNRGHKVLAEMEGRFERFWILTQNIDGFHHAAGSRNVIEIHGNLYRLICTGCKRKRTVDNYADLEIPPRCTVCQQMIRPEVVLFDEALPEAELTTLYSELRRSFDAVITIGTSSHFPYIAQPVIQAHQTGNLTIEINPTQTHVSEMIDIKLTSSAAVTLEQIWDLMKETA